MTIRRATEADRDALRELWVEFAGATPPWVEDAQGETFAELDRALAAGTAAIAEERGETVGFACAVSRNAGAAELTELYVRPRARRSGVATALVRAVLEAAGADYVHVAVGVDNEPARAFYERLGFQPERLILRLDPAQPGRAPGEVRSFGSIHVQTDDLTAVERGVRQFVPRLPGASQGSVVTPPRNGWIGVYDELCDRDPEMLRRLARELSARTGSVVLTLGVEPAGLGRYVLFERGQVVDEYLSVPEHHGQLPPGDVVALGSNPRVMARLTGADPARLREAARTAASPDDLPPATELLEQLADAIPVSGATHGYKEARGQPGAIDIPRS